MMKKIVIISLFAISITFGLFVFMAYLVSSDKVIIETTSENMPIVVMSLPEEKPPEAKPKVIIKPPLVQPKIQRTIEPPQITNEVNTLVYSPPKLDLPSGGGKTLSMGRSKNDEARPIVRVGPKYPLDAIRNGIEGWVVLAFNINTIGEVVNVSVVDSQPKRIFDKAARQALKKWKYRAKVIDGKVVEQQNLTVQLDFKMEQPS